MTDQSARVALMLSELRRAFPQPRYELEFETPVQLLIASILAGGASDDAANRVTRNLFPHLPDAQAFLDVDSGVLEEAIKPAGMTKAKAKWIKDSCRILIDRHGGTVPKDMDALLQLPGVGRKTANVVLQTAYGMETGIIVDTHVARLAPRIGLVEPLPKAAGSDDDDDDDDDGKKKAQEEEESEVERRDRDGADADRAAHAVELLWCRIDFARSSRVHCEEAGVRRVRHSSCVRTQRSGDLT